MTPIEPALELVDFALVLLRLFALVLAAGGGFTLVIAWRTSIWKD